MLKRLFFIIVFILSSPWQLGGMEKIEKKEKFRRKILSWLRKPEEPVITVQHVHKETKTRPRTKSRSFNEIPHLEANRVTDLKNEEPQDPSGTFNQPKQRRSNTIIEGVESPSRPALSRHQSQRVFSEAHKKKLAKKKEATEKLLRHLEGDLILIEQIKLYLEEGADINELDTDENTVAMRLVKSIITNSNGILVHEEQQKKVTNQLSALKTLLNTSRCQLDWQQENVFGETIITTITKECRNNRNLNGLLQLIQDRIPSSDTLLKYRQQENHTCITEIFSEPEQ